MGGRSGDGVKWGWDKGGAGMSGGRCGWESRTTRHDGVLCRTVPHCAALCRTMPRYAAPYRTMPHQLLD